MKSSWDETKAKSKYHFDSKKIDPKYDTVTKLGNLVGDWSNELTDIIANAKPATWETRGYKGKGNDIPSQDLAAEEYDLERYGMDPKMTITHMNWELPPVLQKMSDLFGLDDCMNRIHVQMPGEVWNLHIDKLQKWNPEHPYLVHRIMIHLNDWEMGHFWGYGNYIHSHWKAGDVTTFDWQNVPHCTSNAGHTPRVTLQITGVETEKTREFMNRLRRYDKYTLNLNDGGWF